MDKKIEDYIQEGIYGAKEIKPDERREYLGTIRERVVLTLSRGQVIKQKGLSELQIEMKNNPNAKLLLNGEVSNNYLMKYIKLASKHKIQHTTIFNQEADSKYGAVLAVDYAINREKIELSSSSAQKKEKEGSSSSSLSNWISSLFR
ncbi:YueI family protein [Bacillaceae bacterium S4-13-58]